MFSSALWGLDVGGVGVMIDDLVVKGSSSRRLSVQQALNLCVTETLADVAFLAMPLVRHAGRKYTIVAASPSTEPAARLVAPWIRNAVSRAFSSESTTLEIGRRGSLWGREQASELLIAAPAANANGEIWGTLAVLSPSTEPSWDVVSAVERLAGELSDALEHGMAAPQTQETTRASIPSIPLNPQSAYRDDVLRHEVRVPLSASTFALEALAQRHAQDWPADDLRLLYTAQYGLTEAQSLLRASSQLQSLQSVLSEPYLQPVDLVTTIDRGCALFPFASARLKIDLDERLPQVWADERWLTHVLTNLVENALKYSWPDTSITVSATLAEHDHIVVTVFSRGDAAGENIAAPNVRDRNTSASPDLGNRGLGLSIAKRFVREMGGDIWMETDGHGGVSAIVTLRTAGI